MFDSVWFGAFFAGITRSILRGSHLSLQSGLSEVGIHRVPTVVRPLFLFSNHNKVLNVVAVIAREGRGHPGYPVMCKETGDIFLSQTGAAVWAGTSAANMSSHILGKFPDVNGWTFERVVAVPAVAP